MRWSVLRIAALDTSRTLNGDAKTQVTQFLHEEYNELIGIVSPQKSSVILLMLK
jgi:hypothetical protein